MSCRTAWGIFLAALILSQAGATAALRANASSDFRSNRTILHSDRLPLARGATLGAGYGELPLSFEPNQGQSDRRVKFLSRGNGYSLFLTATEAVLALSKRGQQDPPEMSDPRERIPRVAPGSSTARRKGEVAIVRVGLVGANRNPLVEGIDPLPGTANYFIGKDPHRWRTRIPTYSRVRYGKVYPGIDLVYHGSNQRELEYDFVVAPGADPAAIALRFDGARRLTLNGRGDLIVHVAGGELIEHAPVVFQSIGGVRRTVASRYRLRGSRQAVFEFAAYDHTRAMVVDPVLAYATYLGGSAAASSASAIAADAAGNAFVTGNTESPQFPAAAAAFQIALEGSQNAFVTKLNAGGTALVYSTYLGGSEADAGAGIAVDAAGNAYVTGSASSQNFPTTAGAFQAALKGGTDGFVTELNPSGTALVYSTYLGGSGSDSATAIAVDSTGNAHVTGHTGSADFPTTAGAFQATLNGGANAFVAELAPGGGALVYSTYLGGSLADNALGIAVDSAGNTYVSGESASQDFPTTAGAFQTTLNGLANAFVAKLNASGMALAYSTYLGGSRIDAATGIAVDSAGNAYVSGETRSGNFPTTAGAPQPVLKGNPNAFVTEVNPGGTALIYSTYFGGTGMDVASGIALDGAGNVYVTGSTTSTNLATTTGAFETAFNGGFDAFVCEFNPSGTLAYSTYLGGSGTDAGDAIAVDSTGDAYVTGYTGSTNFPATAGAFQTSLKGSQNAFVAKLNPAGTALVYSTYLGASPGDMGKSIVVDAAGHAYIAGTAYATNFPISSTANYPVTDGAFQTVIDGSADAFVTELNSTGTALLYSTYLGGSGSDSANGIAVDANGNAYVTGATNSTDFPTTAGVLQTALKGHDDAFVARLSATGATLSYSTYLGGSGPEVANGIAVDAGGNAYVTGSTGSGDYPVTAGAFQSTLKGSANAFVTKVNSSATAVAYSTYLGGSGADSATGIALDAAGNGYVTGYTDSIDFPTTAGVLQSAPKGAGDAFVTKLNPSGTALVYSTYLGGAAIDAAAGIAVDTAGNAYVSGETGSADFPATAGAFQTMLKGSANAFVGKLNPNGTGLVYSTYLGGSAIDAAAGIALDPAGNVDVTGQTGSGDFPVTAGAFQTGLKGSSNAFLTELNPAGAALAYSTYLGGSGIDASNAIAVDSAGSAYVTGYTTSTDFPATAGAVQTDSQGYEAAFVAKFPPAATPTPTPSSLSITPPSVNFNQTGIGTAVSAMIKLKNIGKNKLSGSLSNSGLAGTPFSLAAGAGAFQLARNQTKAVTIKFKPASPITYFGTITIKSNDPGNPAAQVGISGTGVPGTLSAPSALNFPAVKVHQSRSLNLSIKNTGLGVLRGSINTSKLTAPFSAKGGSFTLRHGKSRAIAVKFAPAAAGMFQQTILITSDGAPPSSASVSLIGIGK